MIAILKENDLVYAYCEYNVVNKSGQFDNQGLFLYIAELWISPEYRGFKSLKLMISEIENDPKTKCTRYVYYNRDKYEKLSKPILKEKFLKKELANV